MAGESVGTFFQDLYRLAEDCENSALKDNLIWDQIVVGVVDDSLSYRLQAKADLTLEMAVQMSRQAEAWKQNKDLIRGNAISQTANGYRLYTCGFSGTSQKRFQISHENQKQSTVKVQT